MTPDADLVHAALDRPGESWFDGLAGSLAESRWRSVTAATGLDRGTYGTARHLAGDPSAPRDAASWLDLPEVFRAPGPIPVETLHGPARDRYAALGLDFHPEPDAVAGRMSERLNDAFARIGAVPTLAASLGALLAALHVVRPEGPDYDVSYSDPVLPFSIFVGVDASPRAVGDLRLAEGIVHECMHLQLSLVEGTVPLVAGSGGRMHSPWQGTSRPIQGILHGLYVFAALRDFHRHLLKNGDATAVERRHLQGRIKTIDDETRAVGDVVASPELTEAGRKLAARLTRA